MTDQQQPETPPVYDPPRIALELAAVERAGRGGPPDPAFRLLLVSFRAALLMAADGIGVYLDLPPRRRTN